MGMKELHSFKQATLNRIKPFTTIPSMINSITRR